MDKNYDIIILGGGPASMSAGVYAKQMGLKTLVIEKGVFGGQVATTSKVTNYLGFKEISGNNLAETMLEHMKASGVDIANEEIVSTDFSQEEKVVNTHSNSYTAKAVVIGIGTSVRSLGVENEKNYINKGISYSSLRDREKYEGQEVAVVGGGNSAIEDAIYLAEKCSKVHLIHRRQEFRGDKQLVDELYNLVNNNKVELHLDSRPESIVGDNKLETFNITHIPSGSISELKVECVFVAIGRGADTDIIDKSIERNEQGYIITNENMQTNIDGVYAVGDIRTTPLRQIVTAVADGAVASVSAFNYIKNNK